MKFTEKDINALVARDLREQAGLSQKAFWGAVGVQQSVGCRYENDIAIPKPVRLLLLATYVSPAGTALSSVKEVKAMAQTISKDLDRVEAGIQKARAALAEISTN